jgi:peptidoglycan/LPS O-acetylase OafA/YrhL
VLYAAGIAAVEAVGVLAASILAGVNTFAGHAYQTGSGVALALIGLGMAALLGLTARGLRRGRRWSRTPAMLTQLFAGIVAIYLLESHRYDWGIPTIVLAVAGFATLLAPSSLQVLTPGRVEKADKS